MRTLAIAALVAAAGAFSPLVGPARALPGPCVGAFDLDGPRLDLGTGIDPVGRVVLAADATGGLPRVHLGEPAALGNESCEATLVTQAQRTDVFAVRAKFEGCGERPRFRVRLRFDEACEHAVGRVRALGQVIASFTATRVPRRTGVSPVDPMAQPGPTPGDPSDPAPADPVDPPAGDGSVRPIGSTPTITSLAPLVAQPGETISVFGANLDRDRDGAPWVAPGATPPYVVTFLGVDPSFGRLIASPTFVSPGQIDVRVPSTAVSGTLVLAVRSGSRTTALSETLDRLVVIREEPPPAPVQQTGTPPATANRGTLTVQDTSLPLFNSGSFPVTGPFQIGAFLDSNGDHIVNLFPAGRDDVPYLAFPVRTSEFDFTIEGGRGYFQGSNAILWVFFEGGDPAVLDATDQFFVVHLSIDLARRTARPIAMLAGFAGSPGIVMMADQFAAETSITVAQPGGGIGALSGHVAAVPLFLENVFLPSQPGVCLDDQTFCPDTGPSVEQRIWGNGIEIDFDVPLFVDNG
jgi:hypothetical protein